MYVVITNDNGISEYLDGDGSLGAAVQAAVHDAELSGAEHLVGIDLVQLRHVGDALVRAALALRLRQRAAAGLGYTRE